MATLEIGGSSSICRDCRENRLPHDALPSETGHYTIVGYGPNNGKPGCGETWTKAYSVYFDGSGKGKMKERLVSMFPHLAPVLTETYGGFDDTEVVPR